MSRVIIALAFAVLALWPAGTMPVAADHHNCADYPSQAAAQAALRANPSDPNNLDADNDGIACESNPGPYDQTPVPGTEATQPMATASGVYWVRGYPSEGNPVFGMTAGCVYYVAQWSDGSYTSVPWDCDPGVVARDGSRFSSRGYPQMAANGCVEYVTQWNDRTYSWVPFECPPGVTYYKPAPTPPPAPTTISPTTSRPAPTPTPRPAPTQPPTTSGGGCDPSYPTVCIPPPPPDLDCPEIPHRNFPVRQPDPHGFDGRDNDGVGCET